MKNPHAVLKYAQNADWTPKQLGAHFIDLDNEVLKELIDGAAVITEVNTQTGAFKVYRPNVTHLVTNKEPFIQ